MKNTIPAMLCTEPKHDQRLGMKPDAPELWELMYFGLDAQV